MTEIEIIRSMSEADKMNIVQAVRAIKSNDRDAVAAAISMTSTEGLDLLETLLKGARPDFTGWGKGSQDEK